MDSFRLGHGDSRSLKERTEKELSNGQFKLERSGNEGTALYKDWLPSPSFPHLLSMLSVAFSRSSLLVVFAL